MDSNNEKIIYNVIWDLSGIGKLMPLVLIIINLLDGLHLHEIALYYFMNSEDTNVLEVKIMLFVEYPKCSTCQKAKKWLDEHNITYTDRHIVENNPSYDELKQWYERSGLTLKKFFNTSGMLYKEMQLKDKLPAMGEEEQLKLLATNGMLVKRPLIVEGDVVLTGFNEAEWTEKLL